MATPVSYNNTTTELPPVPQHIDNAPERAQVMKTFAHGGMRFVMGKHDTATSLFKTLYGDAPYFQGGASHLQAYLQGRPGGYPKPGDVVEIPSFNDYVGKAKPAALERALDVIDKQEARRCKEQSARPADSATRVAVHAGPARFASSGVSLRAPRYQVPLAALVYGSRW